MGQSLAHLCEKMGYDYQMADDSDAHENFDIFDIIIPSPGIPSSHRVYQS